MEEAPDATQRLMEEARAHIKQGSFISKDST